MFQQVISQTSAPDVFLPPSHQNLLPSDVFDDWSFFFKRRQGFGPVGIFPPFEGFTRNNSRVLTKSLLDNWVDGHVNGDVTGSGPLLRQMKSRLSLLFDS